MIPTAVSMGPFYGENTSLWDNFEISRHFDNFLPSFDLSIYPCIKIPGIAREHRSKYKIVATPRLSTLTPVRVRGQEYNGYGRARGIGATPPKRALERSNLTEKSGVQESHTEAETTSTSWPIAVFSTK